MVKNYVILRTITRLILPFVLIFGFYVLFHGKLSPGGGFQAGAIFASGIILYALVFGLKNSQKVISKQALLKMAAAGMLIFIVTGLVSFLYGYNFLDYSYLNKSKATANMLGAEIVEVGVGITVFSASLLFFYMFAETKK